MLAGMSSAELAYWELVHDEEFLGDERADYNASRVVAAIANWAGRCLNDNAEPLNPFDLMPKWRRAGDDEAEEAARQEALAVKLHCAFAGINARMKQKADAPEPAPEP